MADVAEVTVARRCSVVTGLDDVTSVLSVPFLRFCGVFSWLESDETDEI